MADATTTVADLKQAIGGVRPRARNWNQFHSPKNLSMSLAAEAAELMEHFLWMENARVEDRVPRGGETTRAIGGRLWRTSHACFVR